MTEPADSPFRAAHFERVDQADDRAFYAVPRLVAHIDDPARAALTAYYAAHLPRGGAILDLMSSYVSHLPEAHEFEPVIGLGMNAAELAANPQLDAGLVADLNRTPALPFADASFDGCVIAVSVQYLTRPLDVFAEIGRVLRPGGVCAVSFSNRCFPTKAVALWRALDDMGHARLIGTYFDRTGLFTRIRFDDISPAPGGSDPLFVVAADRADRTGTGGPVGAASP